MFLSISLILLFMVFDTYDNMVDESKRIKALEQARLEIMLGRELLDEETNSLDLFCEFLVKSNNLGNRTIEERLDFAKNNSSIVQEYFSEMVCLYTRALDVLERTTRNNSAVYR